MSKGGRMRALMAEKPFLITPGITTPLHAMIVERAGFDFVYMGGYDVSLTLLGLPDLAADGRFAGNTQRVANRADLNARLAPAFAAGTADHWWTALTQAGVPSGPINSLDQAFDLADRLLEAPRHLGIHSGGMVLTERPIGEVCPADIQCELQRVSDWSFDSDRGVCLGRHSKGVFVLTSDLLVVLSFVPDLNSAWMPMVTFFVYISLNWWATWPAEPVHGQLISNLLIPWEGLGPDDAHRAERAGVQAHLHLLVLDRVRLAPLDPLTVQPGHAGVEEDVGIGGQDLEPLLTGSSYLTLVALMIVAFGISFEFPVVLVFLLLARVLTTAQLRKWRRWAIVLITLFAALITPSQDPYSLLFMAVPMYLFYEASIAIGRVMKR